MNLRQMVNEIICKVLENFFEVTGNWKLVQGYKLRRLKDQKIRLTSHIYQGNIHEKFPITFSTN